MHPTSMDTSFLPPSGFADAAGLDLIAGPIYSDPFAEVPGTLVHANYYLPPNTHLRRNGIDFTETVCSDHWHIGKEQRVVCANRHNHPQVLFHSDDFLVAGVSVTEGCWARCVEHANESVKSALPDFPALVTASLVFNWPGYEHLNYRKPIYFHHPGGRLVTMKEMVIGISRYYRRFFDEHHNDFRPGRGAIRLGPTGVRFGEIRLRKIYTADGGRTWEAEMSYVPAHVY